MPVPCPSAFSYSPGIYRYTLLEVPMALHVDRDKESVSGQLLTTGIRSSCIPSPAEPRN